MSGPASTVKLAVAAGATNTDDIVRATGLDANLVRLVVDELQRIGELVVDHIGYGCPDGACGGCSSGPSCGHSGEQSPTSIPIGQTRHGDPPSGKPST